LKEPPSLRPPDPDLRLPAGFPCFKAGGPRVVKALSKRFALQLAEPACVQHMLQLISDSMDAWWTRQYDHYQRALNGIL
jgi:phosphatidylinositol 4-kinase